MPAPNRLYLDYNAAAPLRAEARAALLAALDHPGNASSVHMEGRDARARIEAARTAVARLAGGSAKGVVFTSGATEANVTALTSAWIRGGRDVAATHLLVSAVEHPSVLRGGRFNGADIRQLPVDGDGVVRLDVMEDMLGEIAASGGVPLVALQLANNETGVIQPVSEAARLAHAAGGFVHCDAVQAAGRVAIDLTALGADTLSLSAHKIGGLQGVGALVLRTGGAHPAPMLVGGGQEGWRRAGTEPVAGIAAFGAAARAALEDLEHMPTVAARRDRLQAALVAISPDAQVFAAGVPRLPNTLALALPGMAAETAVIAFDLEGIAISSGSACSSGKVAASHVLGAMGVAPDVLRAGLRISIGRATGDDDIDRMIAAWQRVAPRLVRRPAAVAHP